MYMRRFIILLIAAWSYINPIISTITASPVLPTALPTFIPKKIVVIGDVHSDIYRFKQILQEANIIDATDNFESRYFYFPKFCWTKIRLI